MKHLFSFLAGALAVAGLWYWNERLERATPPWRGLNVEETHVVIGHAPDLDYPARLQEGGRRRARGGLLVISLRDRQDYDDLVALGHQFTSQAFDFLANKRGKK